MWVVFVAMGAAAAVELEGPASEGRLFTDECESTERGGLRNYVDNLEVDNSNPQYHDMDGARFKRVNARDGSVRYDSLQGFVSARVTGYVFTHMALMNWELLVGTVDVESGFSPARVLNSSNLNEHVVASSVEEGETVGWVKFRVALEGLDCPRSVQVEMRGSATADTNAGWGLQLGAVELEESATPMCGIPSCVPGQEILDKCGEPRASEGLTGLLDDTDSIDANVYEATANVVVDRSNASAFFAGDAARFKRADGAPGGVTYFVPEGVLSMSLTVFACGGVGRLTVTPYSDPDCRPLSVRPILDDSGFEAGCWRMLRANLDFGSSDCPPTFVGIQMEGGQGWELQLSEVRLTGYGVAQNAAGLTALAQRPQKGRSVVERFFPVLVLAACLSGIVAITLALKVTRLCRGANGSPPQLVRWIANNEFGRGDGTGGKPDKAAFDRISTFTSLTPRGTSLGMQGYSSPAKSNSLSPRGTALGMQAYPSPRTGAAIGPRGVQMHGYSSPHTKPTISPRGSQMHGYSSPGTQPTVSPKGAQKQGYAAPMKPISEAASLRSISFSSEVKAKVEPPRRQGHRRGSSFFEQRMRDIQKTFAPAKKPAMANREGELVREKMVGQGGFGSVWKATWEGAPVALKIVALPASLSAEARKARMAVTEAAVSGCLAHPNVVQTFTCDVRATPGEEGGEGDAAAKGSRPWTPWGEFAGQKRRGVTNFIAGGSPRRLEIRLVMEYCDGGSLRDALRERRFLDKAGRPVFEHVLLTALDIARGMRCLHHSRIIHGDLKPGNVLLKL
eukprot:evm.model.scf_1532.1 EVM.evm.TU.scf_1532.1   scf_1532:22095-25262(-)